MEHHFDLIVLGTGTAGSTVARRCREAGWEVAIVDSRPFGGTCALRGCDPKKVLVGAAEGLDWQRRLQGKGLAGETRIDWSELMRFKRTFTDPVPSRREESYEKAGIQTFHGRARFTGLTTVRVDDDTLVGGKVVIATGSKPVDFPFEGSDHLLSSAGFLELEDLPPRIAFLGGGFISFEFAHVAARAGSDVRILEMESRPLRNFEPELVDLLVEAGQDRGVAVETDTEVKAVESTEGGFGVHVRNSTEEMGFETDIVVHGGGRVAEIEHLDLDAAGIEHGPAGVEVSPDLKSVSNPNVYAAGDAADTKGLPLTPVASADGLAVAENLLRDEDAQEVPDYTGTASVVFTLPPLASVGLGEESARERGLHVDVRREDMTEWYTTRRVGERYAASKVLLEQESGRILGAHVLGVHAEEVINLFALAIRNGITGSDLKEVPWAYPTAGSDVSHMV